MVRVPSTEDFLSELTTPELERRRRQIEAAYQVSASDAADLLQGALGGMWEQRESIRHPEAYLRRCVLLGMLRGRDRREIEVEVSTVEDIRTESPDEVMLRGEEQRWLDREIAKLPGDQPAVIRGVLRGESTAGLAVRLRRSEANVRHLKWLALGRLRERWGSVAAREC